MKALVYVVPIALAIYALFDLARSEVRERAGIHPIGWAAVILLLPVLGSLVWILVSRVQRSGTVPPTTPGRTPPLRPPRRPGPAAPDDDPDFLWRLDQQRRRERGSGGPDGASGGGGPGSGSSGGGAGR